MGKNDTLDDPEIELSDFDLDDPLQVLDLLKSAIIKKGSSINKRDVSAALQHVLDKYEQKNRIFLIAAANAELPRIVRLMSFLSTCEVAMFDDKTLEKASVQQLITMYKLAQTNLVTGLDTVKKVADMRLDALRAAGGAEGVEKVFNTEDEGALNALSGLPSIDSQSRDRIRKLLTGLIESSEDDNSVEEYDEDESDQDD